jgi:hypothetical protein
VVATLPFRSAISKPLLTLLCVTTQIEESDQHAWKEGGL